MNLNANEDRSLTPKNQRPILILSMLVIYLLIRKSQSNSFEWVGDNYKHLERRERSEKDYKVRSTFKHLHTNNKPRRQTGLTHNKARHDQGTALCHQIMDQHMPLASSCITVTTNLNLCGYRIILVLCGDLLIANSSHGRIFLRCGSETNALSSYVC